MTNKTPTFRSPVDVPISTGEYEKLKLADLTGVQVLLTQGEAAETLQAMLPVDVPAAPGRLIDLGGALLGRLTPSEFYLFGKTDGAKLPSVPELESQFAAENRSAHATDLTHAKAILKLTGPAAPEALSKICGLDFHDSVFADLQVKQTSAAKVKTLIARSDENGTPVYYLHLNRPFGQYFWDILWDAGQEFGIV